MKNSIELKNINKNFGKKVVIKNLNEQFKLGEMVAITGNSGSGKSTLLNIIGLLEVVNSGDVNIFDKNISNINSKEAMLVRRCDLGYIFQNFALMEKETVFDNLIIALEYTNKSKDEKNILISNALNNFGLKGYENNLVYELSGGQQQRVAMARVTLKPCDIILADEPTASLDSENGNVVIETLKQFRDENKTVIIATHDMDLANLCDRIIKLD